MKKTNLTKSLALGFACASSLMFSACSQSDNPATPNQPDQPIVVVPSVPGIPSDDSATPNPELLPEELNAVLPNFSYSVDKENGWLVVRFDMTGIQDPNSPGEWVRLYGPGDSRQDVWLSVDGKPKGFSIYNTIDESKQEQAPVDLVFLVDNSTSMSEEANAIYRDILEWSAQLSKTLDVRFACVGYGGFVSGAINLTTADELKKYLEEKSWLSSCDGIWRTRGFVGEDAEILEAAANDPNYRVVGTSYRYTAWSAPDASECGVMALRYANDHFKFRSGANRVYVNLTDERNQPGSKTELFSTQWVKDNWTPTQGTIHTVYTQSSSWVNRWENNVGINYPWDLSVYTGGTMLFTNSTFRDSSDKEVKLSDLPVSAALMNSYVIKFTNVEELFDGQEHLVKITVKSVGENGAVLAEKEFIVVFSI